MFRATFDEDVQNVNAADFTVNGTTTATITLVTPFSASVYDATVSGGDFAGFNGTVGLNLAGGQNITDLTGNADGRRHRRPPVSSAGCLPGED